VHRGGRVVIRAVAELAAVVLAPAHNVSVGYYRATVVFAGGDIERAARQALHLHRGGGIRAVAVAELPVDAVAHAFDCPAAVEETGV